MTTTGDNYLEPHWRATGISINKENTMKICKIGLHKYKFIKVFHTRCDNCELIGASCFRKGIKKYQCSCGKIKYKNNKCEVCGYVNNFGFRY